MEVEPVRDMKDVKRMYIIREGGELLQTARENGKYRRANGVNR